MTNNYIDSSELTEFTDLTQTVKDQGIIPGKTWAMATSPSKCLMLKVNDEGKLTGKDGESVTLGEYYEVVVFCADWQITATRNGAGADVEIITEPKGTGNLIKLNQQYLVWGKVLSEPVNGWCEIADPRTGRHPFPAPDGAKGRLILTGREYIERGEHGNAMITRQRLTGIEVYEGENGHD